MNEMTPIQKLTRDLANAARLLSDAEVRFLVDGYYQMQEARIRSEGQIRSLEQKPIEKIDEATGETVKLVEPHEILTWFSDQNASMEAQIKRALEKYVMGHPVGEWLISVYGIGPVISAGLLAHIDINKAPTVGHIWRFAGLDPTQKWEKKMKRPWNARLKVLCWKAGESFVKFHNNDKCFYGKLYETQKALYQERNERGEFAERAAQILKDRVIGKDTEAYKAYIVGRLPPGHIHAMARRYAVKLFLSHLHGEMYRRVLGKEPPLPYPIAQLGHVHMINPPV